MRRLAKILCCLLGHETFTLWTAGGGDIWGDGCYRCGRELQSVHYKGTEDA